MKAVIIIIMSVMISCSAKFTLSIDGDYYYKDNKSFTPFWMSVKLYNTDSIKIMSNKNWGRDWSCLGRIEHLQGRKYLVKCFDTRGNSVSKLSDFTPPKISIQNDTIILYKSHIKIWGVKLKRVSSK